MSRLLCTGDWHVGSGLDYGRTPADRLADQEAVIEKIVDLAIEHDVDALLLAGDFWHRRRPTPSELMAVARPLRRLAAESTIDVLAIPGNHCVEAAGMPTGIDLLEHIIDIHHEPGIWNAPGGTSVATLPWTPVSRLIASRGGGDRDENHQLAAQLLIETARDLRGQIDGPAVLMLHWSVSGAATPTGVMTDDFRETVIPLADLEALGFDAVVCGHIHKPQVLGGELVAGMTGRTLFYVGSPAPVDFGESQSEHGVWLLDTAHWTAEFLPIESRPFVTWDLDLTDGDAALYDTATVANLADDFADAVVRVRYTATEDQARRINHGDITKALYDAGAHKVYAIQPTIERENRARVAVDEDVTPLAAVEAWAHANELSGEQHQALADLTTTYLQEVGAA